MKRWYAYGYNMHSDIFEWNGRTIDGLIVSIKAPSNVTEEMIIRNVFIQFTKEDGFTISIRGNAKNILVQPYKIYFCAEPTDGLLGLEPLEVDSSTIAEYFKYYHEERNSHAESCWLIH